MVYCEHTFLLDRATCARDAPLWVPLYDAFGSAVSLVCVVAVGDIDLAGAAPGQQGPSGPSSSPVQCHLGWNVAGAPSRVAALTWFPVATVGGGNGYRRLVSCAQVAMQAAGPFGAQLAIGFDLEPHTSGGPAESRAVLRDVTVTIGAQWSGKPAEPLMVRAS